MTGLVDVIAAHSEVARWAAGPDDDTDTVVIRCQCGRMSEGPRGDGHPHFRHVADELAAAGTGPGEPPASAARVLKAWTDKGPQPGYHDAYQRELRRGWPVLADALDALAVEAAALQDPEGHALVQAIHDRKEAAAPQIEGHDTAARYRDPEKGITYARCADCTVIIATIDDAEVLALDLPRAQEHFHERINAGMKEHRQQLEANRA